MLRTRVDHYEDVPRDVIATGNEYPAHFVLPAHLHKRGQLLYASTGVVTVISAAGSWVVPPRRALWIPPGIAHEVHMSGAVSTRSAYIRAEAAKAAHLPAQCRVISVSALLHALLLEAAELPADYPLDSREGRLMALLLDEIAAMPTLPLNAPLPRHPRLAHLCRTLLDKPSLNVDIDTMARDANMSRRSFTRLFRRETGMSFGAWRQQACLLGALTRLDGGEPVTRIALELGYGSSSAFTAAFRRALGASPTAYLSLHERQPAAAGTSATLW